MALQLCPQFYTFHSSRTAPVRPPWRKCRSALFSSHLIAWRDYRHRTHRAVVMATSDSPAYKMNLNEYMVTLERPLGIRFALSLEGKVFVHSLRKGGNAERAKIIMVGDTLKKACDASGGGFIVIQGISDAEKMLKNAGISQSMVLERPFTSYPAQQVYLNCDYHILFNRGRVPFATWNGTVLPQTLQPSGRQINSGFTIFCPKFLNHQGWTLLLSQDQTDGSDYKFKTGTEVIGEIVGICSEENSGDIEWTHGSFPLEEYVKALARSKDELYYDHSLGMQYSKITEQIYVGSCIQSKSDVQKLSNMGITAVLNFQSDSERSNWGINSQAIIDSCCNLNILMVNYPIRAVDSIDLRKKLPFSVGLLLRLLRKNHSVFVTCTTGFDRSSSCVIAYLHWIQDTTLSAAHNFLTGLHSCRPDRPAIVWATWDLIAMAETGKSDGSPTHVVNFVWNNGCREGEEVQLIGDFTGNWKEPIKAVHKGGSKYEAELRLRRGKYNYKFIVGGQWKHSTSLPTERDEHGNVNNVIRIGGVARIRPTPNELHIKLHTNKKSCEILAAVADKIKLQLKNADSQIQEDVEKFTGANKTKRKRLESRLDEHRERIRLIHDKFKEEVSHYLLNCRSTLEALEAQNLEMKGTADLQRVQHRKLLLQIEGAMKDQLSAAETTIAAVEKDSKKKFKSLKFALKEWLGEEELSTKS